MDDLQFYLGMHPWGAVAIILSTVLLYAAFAFILSRYGQRLYASPSSLELAIVIVLGAIVGRAILGQVPTLAGGLLALATLFVLESVAGRLRRTASFQKMQQHRAVAVMVDGRVDRAELAKHGLDEVALWGALRGAGVTHPDQVAVVVLERSGAFTVLRAGQAIHPAALTGVRRSSEILRRLREDAADGEGSGGDEDGLATAERDAAPRSPEGVDAGPSAADDVPGPPDAQERT